MSIDVFHILFFLLGGAIGWFARQLFGPKKDRMPVLEEGERIPVVKPGQSNLMITRKGSQTLLVDEQGNEIEFKRTIE